jgi:two-component system phosphate regulon sensor histidine kinase PhoR
MRLDLFRASPSPEISGPGKPIAPLVTNRWERWRPALHIGVLLLVLVGTAVLAVEAYLSHRSYSERARSASHDLAFEAAANLSRWAEQRLTYNLMLYYTPTVSRVEYDTPARQASFSEMALAPAKERCAATAVCAAGPARTTFHYDLRRGAWETKGAPIDTAAARVIRDSIRDEALNRYQKSWELAILNVPSGNDRHIVTYRLAFDSTGKPAAVNGMDMDMPRVAREFFARTLSQGPLLASAQTHGRPNSSLFSVRVVSNDGVEFLRSGPSTEIAPILAQYPKEGNFGSYRVEVGLSPLLRAEAASGREDTRLVRTLLAFAASVILIAIAIFQTRRENALARLRESFVASVSHELRTPLAQIRLYSEMLQMGFVRNQAEHVAAVKVIVHEAGRLTYLIENVLTYSRATRQELRLEASPVDVDGVLRELESTVGPLASAAGVGFRTDADHGLVASADRAALLQILVNLIDNAVRHGTGGKQVVLSARRTENTVQFLVDDCGPGVPRRDRQRIWRRFVRLEGRTRSTGSGIGLSVVSELVAGMNGHVWVTESPMGGARFVVEIPREVETRLPAPPAEIAHH